MAVRYFKPADQPKNTDWNLRVGERGETDGPAAFDSSIVVALTR